MSLLHAALDLAAHGFSVIPIKPDGSKSPAIAWKAYQEAPADAATLNGWFGGTIFDGLGVVTGAVSGNLELLEVEGRALDLVPKLGELLSDSGLGELWSRVCAGWLVQSPSGGLHFMYRVQGPVAGNTKLARRPNAENPQLVDVLIETRGEAGQFVTAPSGGRTHPSGKAWTVLAGGPGTCPILTVEERDALHIAASTFDAMPVRDEPTPAPLPAGSSPSYGGEGLRPGDDYNARAAWDDILTPHGWQRVKKIGTGWGWVRPGKDKRDGISATTGTSHDGADRLYVFSTSTEFETDQPYSKFAALAVLEHGGDYSAAGKALRKAGYGSQGPEPDRVLTLLPGGRTSPGGEGEHQPPGAAPAPPSVEGSVVRQLQPAQTTVSDSEDAHSHRLIHTYGELIRYCSERGRWLAWTGTRWEWQPPGGGEVREYAKKVARALTDREVALPGRRRALSSAGISGCLKQAETDPRVSVAMAQLDADPWTLNTPAGVVDLRTGLLASPNPASLCTKTTTVAPAATPDPIWDRFLDETFGEDHELRGYVQRLVGLTLVGQVREQLLAFLHGQGANGKSTLTKVLMRVLGVGETGYAVAAAAEMLMIRKHSEHPAEIAKLAGARMVVCSELDDSQRFNEARIKDLTGGDLMDARFLYGQPFTFTPTHTMWLYGNRRPQAHTGGMAFWRRVKLIELRHVVPVERRDPGLDDKLYAAGGTVLAWAIQGAVDYLQSGIREPSIVAAATAAYAADQDTIGRFVEDACHRAASDLVRIPAAKLRNAYEAWCREAGEEPASAKRLGQELRDRFEVGEQRSNGRRFYTGVTLLDEPEEGSERPESSAGSGTDEQLGWWAK